MDDAPIGEQGRDTLKFFGLDVHIPVFPISAVAIVAIAVLAVISGETTTELFVGVRTWLVTEFDWLISHSMNFFLLLCVFLAGSKYGKVRLGGPDARPDYSYPSWISMLFSAGVGIGLMYFGVLEPVTHTLAPPLSIAPESEEAPRIGMVAMAYHWGLHGWAIYAIVGLALAYACFNRGLPLCLRSAFYPLFGERIWGWPGHVVDIFAVFATLFGLATSLGYGAEQLTGGLQYMFGVEASNSLRVLLIGGITAMALGSVLAGMNAGIRRLSVLNVVMASLLLLFVLLAGPTLDLLGRFTRLTVDYVVYMPALSNPHGREDTAFFHDWTIFYWVWWMAWAPFVGMFIARISRGRTIREFIVGTLVAPTILCMVWMAVFGGTALDQIASGYGGVRGLISAQTPELALFMLLNELPWTSLMAAYSVILIILFFVTSSDSGSVVIDTVTAGGKLETPAAQRVLWCSLEGVVALALLMGGGLASLQAATVSMGFPFGIVTLLMSYSLYRGLKEDAAAGPPENLPAKDQSPA